jgi:hypothetical protein
MPTAQPRKAHLAPHTLTLIARVLSQWNYLGAGVSAAALMEAADMLVSTGLKDLGYSHISTDDGWMGGRNSTTGEMYPDTVKFPGGWEPVVSYVNSKGLKMGIYSAASSVVCSGRVGSLYNEFVDAATFARWGIEYVKYDNCGQGERRQRRQRRRRGEATRRAGSQHLYDAFTHARHTCTLPHSLPPLPLLYLLSAVWSWVCPLLQFHRRVNATEACRVPAPV